MSIIVGIDGVAGSGKGTVSKIIAKKLGFLNIDTGAMYRCVAKATIDNGIAIEDIKKIIDIAKNINIEMKNDKENNPQIFLNGQDVTIKIREQEVTDIVSQVSSIKEVRYAMVDLQRKMSEGKNIVMEGRDICTYVFPNADVKIYLDATEEERAKRRYKENVEKGIQATYDEILENIRTRDYIDKNKEVGSLKITDESIVIDTTNMKIEDVVDKIIGEIKKIMS
ncbi:MAG: (d)CMP kinase [Lachnospiraceae bacterium]|jgi:cytidylate kinase|nr:(d)CMP kinase [Lachnospiraceae bacterium]